MMGPLGQGTPPLTWKFTPHPCHYISFPLLRIGLGKLCWYFLIFWFCISRPRSSRVGEYGNVPYLPTTFHTPELSIQSSFRNDTFPSLRIIHDMVIFIGSITIYDGIYMWMMASVGNFRGMQVNNDIHDIEKSWERGVAAVLVNIPYPIWDVSYPLWYFATKATISYTLVSIIWWYISILYYLPNYFRR